MRFLIMLEQTETGFAVQVPDLAIVTYGGTVDAAKRNAAEAILANLEAYKIEGRPVPNHQDPAVHLHNPEFRDLLFAYVEVPGPGGRLAA